ncbi:MAG: ABC transporter permease [Erysipelothrix sp.]|nr:ABC transporter permease [Erysipelothrix sp.]
MKLFSSFVKELKLASRGFYFYIEIFMAVLILVVFLFVVPDNFENKQSEYIYLDMPSEVSTVYKESILAFTINNKAETIDIKINKQDKKATLYNLEDKDIYIMNSRSDAIYLADVESKIVAVVSSDSEYNFNYTYYLQGYESTKYKNLLKIIHVEADDTLEMTMKNQDVRPLISNVLTLSDRENMIPAVLVFNGSLMGLFIIAAYVFLDKQEGVIKAFAITPTPVWQYLMSKVFVIMVTSIVSSLIVIVPIMGIQPNYLQLLITLIATAFFSSSLGLLLASFYDNIMKAFGAIYILMMAMLLPSIAYFLPTWSPDFLKFIPTYSMLESFKSIIIGNGDWLYVLSVAGGFMFIGVVLFVISNTRYKKTMIG